ncbi:hypothetical protein A4G19_04805 [Pasteurellaceae bacterium Macca]|nr:hypothetical protein [Pasteurellaceae bacterium Macca]
MQHRFSKFSWALALFCLPSALWPLALLVSPGFSDHPQLSGRQIDLFSITFWVYPFVLLAYAGVCYTLFKKHKAFAQLLLLIGFALFYGWSGYIFQTAF